MELWFALAVTSAVFGGLVTFMSKYAVMHGMSASVVNGYSTFIGTIFFVIALLVTGSSFDVSGFVFLVALINGVFWTYGAVLRMKAFTYIDVTIFYPIYKVLSPLLVIIAGVLYFREAFTPIEWLGLVLSLVVPLLLLSSSEKHRQNNLVKGLVLVVGTSFLAALTAISLKVGVDATSNVLAFTILSNFWATVGAVFIFFRETRETAAQRTQKLFDGATLRVAAVMGLLQAGLYGSYIYALDFDGPLSIVYTINSLYILIPIVLSIIFYKEHWNMRKAAAIALSIAALALLK